MIGRGTTSKVLRIAGKTLLAVLAVLALAIGVTWTFLQTRQGGELVRRFALPRVNAAVAGRIALDKFAFGGDRLMLENLAIYDPEGRLAARVARIDVEFSPLALLRRHIDIRTLEIRRPELALVQDERGLNLARALAPPRAASPGPAEKAPPARGSRLPSVDVRALVVADGVIDLRSSAAGAGRHVHVAELSIHGNASVGERRVAASASVRVRGGRVEARGDFDTTARRGFAALRASVRGLSVDADASMAGEAVAARARVDATDLAVTARALARDFGLPRMALSGRGRLDVEGSGTTAVPSLHATARVAALAVGSSRLQGLSASVDIPNLRVPDALDLDARAATAALGGRSLRSPEIALRAAGRDVVAHASIAAPQPLRVDLRGRRQPRSALTLDALSVHYPEATWTLRRPARLTFGKTIVLAGFELGADAQRLAADVDWGGAVGHAHVVVSRFDVSRLPRALVPPDLGLGGVVDADVRAQTSGRVLRAVVAAKLTGGRVGKARDLSFDLDARLDQRRARGQLRARGAGLEAVARFDLPGAWPPRNPRAPLLLDVDMADTDLARVAEALASARGAPAARVKGRARVSLRLDGRVGEPRLQVQVAGRGLAFDDHEIGDLALTVTGEGDGDIAARLTTTAPARAQIDVKTPLSLRSILRRPPSAAALARTPFELEGNVDRLPLAVLARVAGLHMRLGGTLSSRLAVSGTVSEPEGRVAFDVAGASSDRFPPTDARIELDFDGRAVEARARVTRKGRPLLAAETRVGLPVGAFLERERLAAAPLHVRAVVGPWVVQRLGLLSEGEREAPRRLQGRLHADLSVDGTLSAPRVVFHAQASDVSLDTTPVGFTQIEATYADRQARVDARLTSQGGGTLRATAALQADLGYPAVTRGLDVRRAPLDVRVDAQRFDLGAFSGASRQVREVAGLLNGSGTVRGTIADPRFAGRLEWNDGTLVVAEFGEFKRIHMTVHGDDRGVVLDELSAASGSGSARVTGSAVRRGGKGFDVSVHAKLDRLPIYTQGQPLAVVSLQSRMSGHAAAPETKLNLDIDGARIELPDSKRRDIQSLTTPPDVVLMDGDAPLNRAQAAKLKALTETGRGARHSAPSAGPPAVRLKVNASRHLWVSGQDAHLELGLSPDFHVFMGEKTEVFGQVIVHRGRVDVYGRRFDIKADSTLTFGGPPDRPDLDVRAEHNNTTEQVTVLVAIKGPADNISLSVSAPNRPDLSQSQLYTLILTGHLQVGGGTAGGTSGTTPGNQAASQAASIVGGFLASKLQQSLAHRLPVDVLTIDVGGEGVMGTKVEAGRYITERLYVGYIGRVGSDPTRYQNRNAVHLEYQITSRWEIEGEYGDLGTGTADLMWKKNY